MKTIRTYDDETRREIEEPVARDRASEEPGLVGSRVDTFAAIRAHRGAELARWNYGRRTVSRLAWDVIATPFAPATDYPILLDTEAGYRFDRYAYDGEPVLDVARASGGAFVCNSPGLYNLKAVFRGRISPPAVFAYNISEVQFGYYYAPTTPFDPAAHPAGRHELSAVYRQGVTIPGFPPVNLLTSIEGWSLAGADKIAMRCGDRLYPFWRFEAAGQIEFLENFFCRVALARVGDIPTTDEGCC